MYKRQNINKASAKEIAKLPGISKTKARRLVAWREENGPFKSFDDLKEVYHESKKTGRKIYDFATKSGRFKKAVKFLIKKKVITLKGGSKKVDEEALWKYLVPEPVDINKATYKELKAIPGFSSTKAKSLIKWREENGPFSSVEDLKEVYHKSRKTGRKIYDFCTKTGRWKSFMKPLIKFKRLVAGKVKGAKYKKKEEEDEEEYPEDY